MASFSCWVKGWKVLVKANIITFFQILSVGMLVSLCQLATNWSHMGRGNLLCILYGHNYGEFFWLMIDVGGCCLLWTVPHWKCVRKQAEQVTGINPVSNILAQTLFQLMPSGYYVRFLPDFPHLWTMTCKMK